MSENAEAEALVEYEGKMIYPEVAEYLKSEKTHELDLRDALAQIEYEHQKAHHALQRDRIVNHGRSLDQWNFVEDSRAMSELAEERSRKRREARNASNAIGRDLLINSPHKEVKWIAEHCLFANQGDEVEGHAKTILKNLPNTTEELWRIAKDDAGMCTVFDTFYERAEADGVFMPDGEKPIAYRQLAALRNYIRREYGPRYVASFNERLNPILRALEENYAASLEAAKAEWQKQDEAYAEQVHRNRSEGARRAAETRRRNAHGMNGQNKEEMQEDVTPERGPVVAFELTND